jgi:hypothetical protein
MLLKTSGSNSNIAELNPLFEHKSGQELLLIGRVFDLSKPAIASQEGTVSYVTDRSVVLNSTANKYIFGFAAAGSDGKLNGLVYIRNNIVYLVRGDTIENFFKNYLENQ